MKKLIIIFVGLFSLMSCKKFLSEYSQTDVIPKSASDYGEILFTEGYPSVNIPLQPWAVFLSDDVQCYYGPSMAGSSVAATARTFYQWQPNFDITANDIGFGSVKTWEVYYKLLMGTNVALQYLDKSIGSQSEINQFKGEAYTLRAFYHFMLVNLYGRPYNDSTTTPEKSLGVPIRTIANLSDEYLMRNSVKEVYEQIEKDLDSATFLLDQSKTVATPIKISYLAAHLLASRVYLYEEKWNKAIEHAAFVVQHHPQLMDYNDWPGIGDVNFKPLTGTSNIETLWGYGIVFDQVPYPFAAAYDASHDLFNCFEPDDLRGQKTINVTPDFLKQYVAADYTQYKNSVNSLDITTSNMTNSWRSAEAYLNLAEALIQKYKVEGDAAAGTKAVQELNILRQNRFAPATFVPWTLQPADKMLEMCRNERRRELHSEECHRWFDLRRYGMPSISHMYVPDAGVSERYTLKKGDPQYTISIPRDAMLRNPAPIPNPTITGTRQPE